MMTVKRRDLAPPDAAEGTGRGWLLPNIPTFEPNSVGDEFELFDCFVRGAHRDDRRRGHAVAETAEIIGRDDIVGADHGAPRLSSLMRGRPSPAVG